MLLLLFMLSVSALLGLLIHRRLLNPLTVFNGVWFAALLLYHLELTAFPSGLSERGFQVFMLMYASFNLCYFYFLLVNFFLVKKINGLGKFKLNFLSADRILKMFNLWLGIILLEVIYSKGFPLLWSAIGISKSYASFGIPTVHGFVNSLAWVISMSAFIHYLDTDSRKEKKSMVKIIAVLCVGYIMLLARQTIVTGFVQIFAILLLKRKVSLKTLLSIGILGIILFGIAGNIRSGADHFRMVAGITSGIPDFLLGFYWVYMYVATPVGNVNSLVNYRLVFSNGLVMTKAVLPTVLMGILFGASRFTYHDFLVNKAFNVSSFLLVPYLDFGFYGVAVMSALFGAIGYFTWRSYSKQMFDAEAVMQYAVFFQIMAMSFFREHAYYVTDYNSVLVHKNILQVWCFDRTKV